MVKVGHKTAPGVLKNSYLFEGIYQKRIFLSCLSHPTRAAVAAPQANFLEGSKLNGVNFHSCRVQQVLLAIECKGISCTPCLPGHAHTQQAGPSGLLNKPQQTLSEHRRTREFLCLGMDNLLASIRPGMDDDAQSK